MPEPIKFTQQELDSLKNIQLNFQENIMSFGQLYLDKMTLDEKIKELSRVESDLRSKYGKIQKDEDEWLNSITTKYGEGSLNLKDGTFIPNPK
jgi:hypothetical protein